MILIQLADMIIHQQNASPLNLGHIILMKERKQFEPFDFHKENILRYLDQRGARNAITERKLDDIVKASNGTVTKEQLLEQRADSLSAVNPEMRYLIKEYHDLITGFCCSFLGIYRISFRIKFFNSRIGRSKHRFKNIIIAIASNILIS